MLLLKFWNTELNVVTELEATYSPVVPTLAPSKNALPLVQILLVMDVLLAPVETCCGVYTAEGDCWITVRLTLKRQSGYLSVIANDIERLGVCVRAK